MRELGLKSRVFIYYLQNVKGNETTDKFHIEFISEDEKTKYYDAAKTKLIAKHGERFVNKWKCFIKSEAEIMLENEAFEARKWLLENGYLFQYETTKHKGQMTIRHTGVAAKGWEVAPKYLALIK